MFQFARYPSCAYVFTTRCSDVTRNELPHSGISGSKPVCGSPEHFVAGHALLRLFAPRHPPFALCSLTKTRCLAALNEDCLPARYAVIKDRAVRWDSPETLRPSREHRLCCAVRDHGAGHCVPFLRSHLAGAPPEGHKHRPQTC